MLSLKFHPALLVSDTLKKRSLKMIKIKLIYYPKRVNLFLIVLSKNPKEQLEIFHSLTLNQKYYRKMDFIVIGIGKTYDEILELLEEQTQIIYNETGNVLIKEYYLRGIKC